MEEIREELEKEELEKLSDAEQMQIRIDDTEKYMENSALMQINAYEKPVLEIQYYIKSDYIINYTKDSKRDYTDKVTTLYNISCASIKTSSIPFSHSYIFMPDNFLSTLHYTITILTVEIWRRK